MTFTFNLTEAPWIPCMDAAGNARELSLLEVLTQAHSLRDLGGESPLVTAALYRLLLAILHRVYAGPAGYDDWAAIWEARRFDADLLSSYFARWYDRFDLFHPERPFYQAPDDRVKPKSVTALVHHVASGNNATLFDHHTDQTGLTLTPPEAARMLLAAQAFGMGGLSGLEQKFTGAPWVGGVIFFMQGKTLFETLVLNLLRYDEERPMHQRAEDRPAWEMGDPFSPDRKVPYGYLDYLTWQNRRILFLPEPAAAGSSSGVIVREMTVAPALRLESDFLDPQKHYRKDAKLGYLALRFNEDRALWRDSAALLSLQTADYRPPLVFDWVAELLDAGVLSKSAQQRILALGMANDKAKVEFYRSEQWPLPFAYLEEQSGQMLVETLQDITKMADDVSNQLWGAMRTLAILALFPEVDPQDKTFRAPPEVGSLMAQWDFKRRYWSQLEVHFRRILEQVPADRDAARRAWQKTLRRVAWSAFNGIAKDLARDPRALKAFVNAQQQLAAGLAKVLPDSNLT